MAIGESKLNVFLDAFVHDLGAVMHAATVVVGAQAGEARLREVVQQGGFRQFRRAAEPPFNLVFEARP